jgi:ornithine cyclodeaminase/alanine dehydrogenase-like protein (mu-crystallin family)
VHPDATRAASFAALHQAQAGTPTAVADAAIVACCTTAREPLFDGTHLRAGACVIAIGSHEPTAREVDDAVVRTAAIVVEARSAALREAGDLVIPLHRGGITPESLADLGQLVRGEVTVAPERQRFFKSVGMGWEDLVVAGAVYQALTA